MSNAQVIKESPSTDIYQAVGTVCGLLQVTESKSLFIDLEGATFRITSTLKNRKRLFTWLETNPQEKVCLRVFPCFDNENKIYFYVTKIHLTQPRSELTANQFLLAGLWHYLPEISEQPVFTIHRNKLNKIENKKTLRSKHITVQGFPEEPYKHEPEENQPKGKTTQKFYTILTRLNPKQRSFEYVTMLDSSEDIPPHVNRTNSSYYKTNPARN